MAKDPAFLFYTNDFDSGTKFFTDEQVGKYLRLLMAQHQHGHLSEKQVIHICKTYDNEVMKKFVKDTDGNFFNERLELEANRRKNFTESRKANRSVKNKDSDSHMKNISKTYVKHMENENENENIDTINIPYSEKFKKVWIKWKQYRKEQHQTEYKGLQSEDMALMNLNELSNNNEDSAIEIINHTISNTWKNFIVPKSQKKHLNSQPQFDPVKK